MQTVQYPPHIPNQRAREQVWLGIIGRLKEVEASRRHAAADAEAVEVARLKLVHEAAEAGMTRRQIAEAIGVSPARAHQLATQDPPGYIYWTTQEEFIRETQLSVETGEVFDGIEPLPGSAPPLYRKHQLGARLATIRRGLHPGTPSVVLEGADSARSGDSLAGRVGTVLRFLALGTRPVVEVDLDPEGPTMLYADQVRPLQEDT